MLHDNALIINGKSTADLPFLVAVEENDAVRYAKRKDKVFEEERVTGYLKQSIEAYEGIKKSYKLWCKTDSKKELRKLKAMLSEEGWFTPSDEPDLRYYYISLDTEWEVLDEVMGYPVTLVFYCQPFGMETPQVQTITNGQKLTNYTNAPMFPLIKVTGKSTVETFVQIGEQKMYLKELQEGQQVFIECTPGKQDAYTNGKQLLNERVRGNFFIVHPGDHIVNFGEGITNLEITCRWGWR
ncbi:hypothetical protein [Abiotrophia defectiva]|uniref:hypothetical protein n=1 Tax=Abiotrophia defectiva TaxID=46125 RepID=UPI0026EB82B9|nr:hypothetical protein [Abiotrophia defectiva]